MRRILIIAAAALSLAACDPGGGRVESTPGPVANTLVDERAIALGFAAAEEVTALSRTLREGGHPCCVPGSVSAGRVAGLLEATAKYLEAASAAQKLANNGLASLNLRTALAAIAEARAIITAEQKGEVP